MKLWRGTKTSEVLLPTDGIAIEVEHPNGGEGGPEVLRREVFDL